MYKYTIINKNSRRLTSNDTWTLNVISNRLYYCIDGEAYYTHNNEQHYFKPGYVYLIPADFDYHPAFNLEKGFYHTYYDFLTTIPLKISEPLEINIAEIPYLHHAFLAVTEIFSNSAEIQYDIASNKYIQDTFFFIMQILSEKFDLENPIDERIQTVIRYIQKNYTSEISINELASLLHLDMNYFIKLFKRNTNITPQKYIKNYKLSKSVALLMDGMKISDVAEIVGYSSIYAYSSAFKKVYNISPKKYQLENT